MSTASAAQYEVLLTASVKVCGLQRCPR